MSRWVLHQHLANQLVRSNKMSENYLPDPFRFAFHILYIVKLYISTNFHTSFDVSQTGESRIVEQIVCGPVIHLVIH